MLFPKRRACKSVLVTGSSSGLGKRIADDLAAKGSKVVYHSKVNHKFDVPNNCTYKYCDLSDKYNADRLIEEIEKYTELDCIVCCAGRTTLHPTNDTSLNFIKEEAFKVFNDIEFTTSNICQSALPKMINRKRGKVIIIGGDVVDKPNQKGYMCSYAMAKSAVHQYGLYLAQELKSMQSSVSVNVVAPTGIIRENEIITAGTRDSRISASDVSELVCQLCLSDSLALNGQIIRINDGRLAY